MPEVASDVIVVGAGVGGLTCSRRLVQRGFKVTILDHAQLRSNAKIFSASDLLQNYNNSAFQLIYGLPPIPIAIPHAVGGGFAVNSGLLQRPAVSQLNQHENQYDIQDWDEKTRDRDFYEVESIFPKVIHPDPQGFGRMIEEGAQKLNWKSERINKIDFNEVTRGNTSQYFFDDKSANLNFGTQIHSIKKIQNQWIVVGKMNDENFSWKAPRLVLAAGPLKTPLLLNQVQEKFQYFKFKFHLFSKAIADFPDFDIGHSKLLDTVQIKEFSPTITLGCSVTQFFLLRLHLAASRKNIEWSEFDLHKMNLFYSMISINSWAYGMGRSLLFYRLSSLDRKNLFDANYKLAQLLFSAGATTVNFGSSNLGQISKDMLQLLRSAKLKDFSHSSVHFFASLRAGEAQSCRLNSFGEVKGCKKLWVSDASAISDSPGVNPQLLVMAIADRVGRNIY